MLKTRIDLGFSINIKENVKVIAVVKNGDAYHYLKKPLNLKKGDELIVVYNKPKT